MKKILLFICTLFYGVAFAAGDNTPTSKSYVDTVVAEKQDNINANDGTAMVLTNTGTAGEYGTKGIYDSTGSYAEQTDALIDAQTMNAAVQNAINAEFVCISWVDDDPTKDCLLMDIRGETGKPSGKNLFDINNSKVLYKSAPNVTVDKNSNAYTVTLRGERTNPYAFAMVEFGNINDFLGKTLTLSEKHNCINGGVATIGITMCNNDCSVRQSGNPHIIIIPQQPESGFTKIALRIYGTAGGGALIDPACTYTDIQIEEGSVATAYEPYKNLYLPSGN